MSLNCYDFTCTMIALK